MPSQASQLRKSKKQEYSLSVIEKPTKVNFRILILDDEIAKEEDFEVKTMPIMFKLLTRDNWGKYKRSFSSESSQEFNCIYNSDLGIEVVLCPSLVWAADALVDVHFDLCLIDIDFRQDPHPEHSADFPKVGSLFFAASRQNKYNSISVFTGLGEELRKNLDYTYALKYSKKQKLGNLFINELSKEQKNLELLIRKSFYTSVQEQPNFSWCVKVLPLLKPTPDSALTCGMYLLQDNFNDNNGSQNLVLQTSRGEGISREIPNKLIWLLLENDQNRKEVASLLLKETNGHALVRRIFCKTAHGHERVQAINGRINGTSTWGNQTLFNQQFSLACSLFGIPQDQEIPLLKAILKEATEDKKELLQSKYFRINLADYADMIYLYDSNKENYQKCEWEKDKDKPSCYIYGLWWQESFGKMSPDDYASALVDHIKQVVNDNKENKDAQFQIKWKSIGTLADPDDKSYGWEYEITGNRPSDSDYLTQCNTQQGGTIPKLKELLLPEGKKYPIAAEVKIKGCKGSYDLRTGTPENDITDKITVYIKVIHESATD